MDTTSKTGRFHFASGRGPQKAIVLTIVQYRQEDRLITVYDRP
jgi:hypothetical protein